MALVFGRFSLFLHPFFGYWVSFTEEFRRRAIDAAYEQTLEQRDRIAALVARPVRTG